MFFPSFGSFMSLLFLEPQTELRVASQLSFILNLPPSFPLFFCFSNMNSLLTVLSTRPTSKVKSQSSSRYEMSPIGAMIRSRWFKLQLWNTRNELSRPPSKKLAAWQGCYQLTQARPLAEALESSLCPCNGVQSPFFNSGGKLSP